jgi:hypothetical protein
VKLRKWALVAAVMVGLIGWLWWYANADQRMGEQVVAKVEKFRQVNGRLPESLREVGIETDLPVYYEKRGSDQYIVWYPLALTLGESMTYDSQARKWE